MHRRFHQPACSLGRQVAPGSTSVSLSEEPPRPWRSESGLPPCSDGPRSHLGSRGPGAAHEAVSGGPGRAEPLRTHRSPSRALEAGGHTHPQESPSTLRGSLTTKLSVAAQVRAPPRAPGAQTDALGWSGSWAVSRAAGEARAARHPQSLHLPSSKRPPRASPASGGGKDAPSHPESHPGAAEGLDAFLAAHPGPRRQLCAPSDFRRDQLSSVGFPVLSSPR